MRRKLKLVRNVVVAGAIVAALGFGENRTSACVWCDPPPDEPCTTNAYCAEWCVDEQGCAWGECDIPGSGYCECVHK